MPSDTPAPVLPATSLSVYSACHHAALLEREVRFGRLRRPKRHDPSADLRAERGREHEKRVFDGLARKHGVEPVLVFSGVPTTAEEWEEATRRTLEVMREGHAVLYQAPLQHGGWRGTPDFLLRVDHTADELDSRLGSFHYAPLDAKLSRAVSSKTVLQLCVYTELLGQLQGRQPNSFWVVSPGEPTGLDEAAVPKEHQFFTADFGAYFRFIRRSMQDLLSDGALDEVYPEPCEPCEVCDWWARCDERRRADDHLSFVAGLDRAHRKVLEQAGIDKLEKLAKVSLPMVQVPQRMSRDSFERYHHQARLQYESPTGAPRYDVLPIDPPRGLCQLPERSTGDVFLDIEADRYDVHGTFHYLFGWYEVQADGSVKFENRWAMNRQDERVAFEGLVDRIVELRNKNPGMHVYHFAPFEKTALGTLSLRYVSREEKVDELLRNGVLVDLYSVVRQGVRVGVESYSLKDLEKVYGFSREVEPRDAAHARRRFELDRHRSGGKDLSAIRATIEIYNREDCDSTRFLREWLENVRTELMKGGTAVPRPALLEKTASENIKAWTQRVKELVSALTAGIPDDPDERTEGQNARQLLADVLDWHWREKKPEWWDYFRLTKLGADELFRDRSTIGGLFDRRDLGKPSKRAELHHLEYSFPEQDCGIKEGDRVCCPLSFEATDDEDFPPSYEVVSIDLAQRRVTLKSPVDAPLLRTLVPVPKDYGLAVLQNALAELADALRSTLGLQNAADERGPGRFRAAEALLLREPPRLKHGVVLERPNESPADALKRVAPFLDGTVLAVQGPPGAGKTYAGSRMILDLLEQGKKVGICAPGHEAIKNLLEGVHDAAKKEHRRVRSIQKITEADQEFKHADNTKAKETKKVVEALDIGATRLAAGTAWLWADPQMWESVDVLVIDEAGQFSLANALAVSVAADSMVLLGDPQQLAQPSKIAHPPGAGASALEHLLEGQPTIPKGKGLFLDKTWRLPPAIARYTSQHFYSGILEAHPSCSVRAVSLHGAAASWSGSGIFINEVHHVGNVHRCPEEAERIRELIQLMLAGTPTWTDRESNVHRLEQIGIIVVAPYNGQVQTLEDVLRRGGLSAVRVGTVDKFQGKEAPVVIYSMTTSHPEDAPRGLQFLYSANRINVATSRSQGLLFLVASPRLFEAECRTPEQMRLVNALCGLREHARSILRPS